jgi:hypothetical protein
MAPSSVFLPKPLAEVEGQNWIDHTIRRRFGPVIGPVNPGVFRHVCWKGAADRASYLQECGELPGFGQFDGGLISVRSERSAQGRWVGWVHGVTAVAFGLALTGWMVVGFWSIG